MALAVSTRFLPMPRVEVPLVLLGQVQEPALLQPLLVALTRNRISVYNPSDSRPLQSLTRITKCSTEELLRIVS